jgi:ABC-2 type transport system ATP-binding protein
VISVQNFHKSYGDAPAVKGVSFRVDPGQVLGLIGPNGAGKTTILKSLIGMIPPTSGQLSVQGHDVVNEPVEVKRRLAYIPDDPSLFPDMTVEEHLAFIAAAYHVDQADRRSRELLEQFGLTAKRFSRAADLSRGMRQKLSICCAYLRDPVAILFDEPLTGLDPIGIRLLKQTVRERCEQGAAVMISSHLLAMVEDICSHVLILESGRARFVGSLQELKARHSGDSEVALEQIFFETIGSPEDIGQLQPA